MALLRDVVAAGIAIALLSAAARAQQEQGVLVVYVEGIEATEGQILVELYGTRESFMSEPSVSGATPAEPSADFSLRIEDVPPGEYAVCVWHDVDGDGRLQRSLMGRAKEPIGFSNGARYGFAPPGFSEAVMRIDAGLNEVVIRF